MFFGRKIRDEKAIVTNNLQKPISFQTYNPSSIDSIDNEESADSELSQANNEHKKEFQLGDNVRIQNQATLRWDTKAKVVNISTSGRTLELITEEGVKVRRNRRFIRPKCAAQSN